MNKIAQALARMRKGVKEKPSEAKRQAVRANLEKARAKWAAMSVEDRARK